MSSVDGPDAPGVAGAGLTTMGVVVPHPHSRLHDAHCNDRSTQYRREPQETGRAGVALHQGVPFTGRASLDRRPHRPVCPTRSCTVIDRRGRRASATATSAMGALSSNAMGRALTDVSTSMRSPTCDACGHGLERPLAIVGDEEPPDLGRRLLRRVMHSR